MKFGDFIVACFCLVDDVLNIIDRGILVGRGRLVNRGRRVFSALSI